MPAQAWITQLCAFALNEAFLFLLTSTWMLQRDEALCFPASSDKKTCQYKLVNYLLKLERSEYVYERRALWLGCGVLDPEPGAQRVAVLLELCLESLCSFKKPDCVQPHCWWDNMNAKPVALLGKLRVQQGKETVERTEKHSQVCQASGLSCIGNCCFKASLNAGVRMFQSLRLA